MKELFIEIVKSVRKIIITVFKEIVKTKNPQF
jgi:hypothetical protein